MHCIVILAGGNGKRLWPKSRLGRPKQFLSITHRQSMLQSTVSRFAKFVPLQDIHVVTIQKYEHIVLDQLPFLSISNVIVEPEGKDTAASIGLSAIRQLNRGRDPVMVTSPADAYVRNDEEFEKCIAIASEKAAKQDHIVTIGISPNKPETGFGYIQVIPETNELCYKVEKFIEKPATELARKLLTTGFHYWNSGIFVWKASTILGMIEKHLPMLYTALIRMERSFGQESEHQVIAQEYKSIPQQSVDYGIIEKADNVYMVPATFGWNDVGNWASLGEIGKEKDENGNTVLGTGVGIDTHHCIIDGREIPIAAIGLENIIIVSTKDAILVCKKGREHEIKDIYELLLDRGMNHLL
ncbi:mannose-1-phosphate guanylyltransferase [Cohnella sp.]|uniref:mannose-1-phosphate guanylyltransferase n=1 Tax=Cohnella sp. TaxID=1883426 RepID=UPI003566407C